MTTILAITSNPEPQSLTNAVGRALLEGARIGGAQTEFLDLYEIGFNPVYLQEDREHYLGRAQVPQDVAKIQDSLVQADVISLIFPVYWYTMPAMMKGFFDRVICRGFAYFSSGEPGALVGKKIRVIMLTGGSQEWYESDGIGQALENQIQKQTFEKYCGVSDVEFVYVDNLAMGDDDPARREAAERQLLHIQQIGANLVA